MRVLFLILDKALHWCIPLGLFVWSIFKPKLAAYVFLAGAALFEGYLIFLDAASKPSPDPSTWTSHEIEVLRRYHLALRYPFGAREMSVILNGFRWSSLLWVPWLLWNHLWVLSSIIGLNFFITGSLAFKLDPFFFLSVAVNRGKIKFENELSLLQKVAERLRSQHGS